MNQSQLIISAQVYRCYINCEPNQAQYSICLRIGNLFIKTYQEVTRHKNQIKKHRTTQLLFNFKKNQNLKSHKPSLKQLIKNQCQILLFKHKANTNRQILAIASVHINDLKAKQRRRLRLINSFDKFAVIELKIHFGQNKGFGFQTNLECLKFPNFTNNVNFKMQIPEPDLSYHIQYAQNIDNINQMNKAQNLSEISQTKTCPQYCYGQNQFVLRNQRKFSGIKKQNSDAGGSCKIQNRNSIEKFSLLRPSNQIQTFNFQQISQQIEKPAKIQMTYKKSYQNAIKKQRQTINYNDPEWIQKKFDQFEGICKSYNKSQQFQQLKQKFKHNLEQKNVSNFAFTEKKQVKTSKNLTISKLINLQFNSSKKKNNNLRIASGTSDFFVKCNFNRKALIQRDTNTEKQVFLEKSTQCERIQFKPYSSTTEGLFERIEKQVQTQISNDIEELTNLMQELSEQSIGKAQIQNFQNNLYYQLSDIPRQQWKQHKFSDFGIQTQPQSNNFLNIANFCIRTQCLETIKNQKICQQFGVQTQSNSSEQKKVSDFGINVKLGRQNIRLSLQEVQLTVKQKSQKQSLQVSIQTEIQIKLSKQIMKQASQAGFQKQDCNETQMVTQGQDCQKTQITAVKILNQYGIQTDQIFKSALNLNLQIESKIMQFQPEINNVLETSRCYNRSQRSKANENFEQQPNVFGSICKNINEMDDHALLKQNQIQGAGFFENNHHRKKQQTYQRQIFKVFREQDSQNKQYQYNQHANNQYQHPGYQYLNSNLQQSGQNNDEKHNSNIYDESILDQSKASQIQNQHIYSQISTNQNQNQHINSNRRPNHNSHPYQDNSNMFSSNKSNDSPNICQNRKLKVVKTVRIRIKPLQTPLSQARVPLSSVKSIDSPKSKHQKIGFVQKIVNNSQVKAVNAMNNKLFGNSLTNLIIPEANQSMQFSVGLQKQKYAPEVQSPLKLSSFQVPKQNKKFFNFFIQRPNQQSFQQSQQLPSCQDQYSDNETVHHQIAKQIQFNNRMDNQIEENQLNTKNLYQLSIANLLLKRTNQILAQSNRQVQNRLSTHINDCKLNNISKSMYTELQNKCKQKENLIKHLQTKLHALDKQNQGLKHDKIHMINQLKQLNDKNNQSIKRFKNLKQFYHVLQQEYQEKLKQAKSGKFDRNNLHKNMTMINNLREIEEQSKQQKKLRQTNSIIFGNQCNTPKQLAKMRQLTQLCLPQQPERNRKRKLSMMSNYSNQINLFDNYNEPILADNVKILHKEIHFHNQAVNKSFDGQKDSLSKYKPFKEESKQPYIPPRVPAGGFRAFVSSKIQPKVTNRTPSISNFSKKSPGSSIIKIRDSFSGYVSRFTSQPSLQVQDLLQAQQFTQ